MPRQTAKAKAGNQKQKQKQKQTPKTNPKSAIKKASPYTDKWLNTIMVQHQSHLKGSAPVIDSRPISITQNFQWTRTFDNLDVVTQAEFELAKAGGQVTTKPCGYAIAIDITGYDEWEKITTHDVLYRVADNQIYHIDSAQLVGSAHDFRVNYAVGVPVTQTLMGESRPLVVAATQKTVYPYCSPSSTSPLSFGHTIRSDERRPEFYKYYGENKFRRYMQVGVYSPTVSGGGGPSGSGDVGSASIRLKTRSLTYASGAALSENYTKTLYPPVIDYPIYDPAMIVGPVGANGAQQVTIVQEAPVTAESSSATGRYYVTLASNALDAIPRINAVYKLEKPLYVNTQFKAGATPQPSALRFFRFGLMTGHTGDPKGYLFSHILDAMLFKDSLGTVTGSTYYTSSPIRMFKEVNASGVASGGRGLSSVINVAHSGLEAPALKRAFADAHVPDDAPFSLGKLLDDPRTIKPQGITTKVYGPRG